MLNISIQAFPRILNKTNDFTAKKIRTLQTHNKKMSQKLVLHNLFSTLPCIGILLLFCMLMMRLLLPITAEWGTFPFDDAPLLCLFFAPMPVRTGRCVVVILVKVYGGKLSSISESIIRAMCWKPDVVGAGLQTE